ncbi:MAG: hypothetical protein LBC80_10660 [Treponema sp.]|nr:hypothetical protein [Treponema sp.]
MVKKIIPISIIVLLFFIGIIALTQEFEEIIPGISANELNGTEDEDIEEELPENIRQAKWFRSNAGGMALEELHSRYVALRNEYALVIDYVLYDELPEYIRAFYVNNYIPEIRMLYKNGEVLRTQWILRDENWTTRLNAVVIYPPETDEDFEVIEIIEETETEEDEDDENEENEKDEEINIIKSKIERINVSYMDEDIRYIVANNKTGFIEIFNENSFIKIEYRFSNEDIIKAEYEYNNNHLVSSLMYYWDNETNKFVLNYKDYYRYNRSFSLRAVERIFYQDMQLDNVPIIAVFPRHFMDSIEDTFAVSQRLNEFPVFFGDVFVYIHSKIIYENDGRGRAQTQTLYDENDKVVWTIINTWEGDRIVSMVKIEGDTELKAEFEYDSGGNKIVERNYVNGVLERIVHTDESTETEDLYIDNVLVLRAVWEDGRKISEIRMR